MGTFHSDRGPLHGITVVVNTKGPHVYVGRCDVIEVERIVLVDVDVHEDGHDGRSKDDYIRQVARVGYWGEHERVEIPLGDVASIDRLGQISL